MPARVEFVAPPTAAPTNRSLEAAGSFSAVNSKDALNHGRYILAEQLFQTN